MAAKIVRGTDRQLLELWLKRRIRIEEIVDDDPGPAPQGDFMETPDRSYLVRLPDNPDESLLARGLLLKLYELGPEETRLWIQESRYRTSIELEETAYQNRKRRIEDMGFQDYFDALDVYTYLPPGTSLPEKIRDKLRAVGTLPAPVASMKSGPLLLFQAMAAFARPHELEPLMEELFFVCNKILSADRTPPNRTSRVKRDPPLDPGIPVPDLHARPGPHWRRPGLRQNYPLLLVEIRKKRRRKRRIEEAAVGFQDYFFDASHGTCTPI